MSDGGFTPRSSAGIWHSLNRFVFTLIVLAAAVPIASSFLPEVRRIEEHQRRIEALKAEIESEQMRLKRKEHEVQLLTKDPEYVSIIARDRLDVMKEGETIYRLDPPKLAPAQMRRNP